MKRLLALTGPLLIALMMAAPSRAAVLETLTVQASALEVTKGTVTLKEGTEYTLRASGTFDNVGPEGVGNSYDALFCIDAINQSTNTCADHHRGEQFRIRTGSGFFQDIDAFGGPIQTYRSDNVYTVKFEPPATGVLEAGMHIARTNCTTCQTRASGAITVQISGPGGGGSPSEGAEVTHASPVCDDDTARAIFSARTRCRFGTVGTLPAPDLGDAADISTVALPPKTNSVEAIADVQDAADEQLLEEFIAVLVKARRNQVKDQLQGCLIMGGLDPRILYLGVAANRFDAILTACVRLVVDAQGARAAATSGCRATFVPGFRRKPSKRQVRRARAAMKATLAASCDKGSGTQLHLTVAARKGTLNQALGSKVTAAAGVSAPEGTDTSDGRLQYTWGYRAG